MIFNGPAHFPIQAAVTLGQSKTEAASDALVKRDLKNKQLHRMHVHLSIDTGDDPETIDYEFVAITRVTPNSTDATVLDFKIGDYVIHAADHVIKKKLIGAGKLSIGPVGLPSALMDSMSDAHFWYPLLSLYLPEEVKSGAFEVDQPLGTRVLLHGTGKVRVGSYEMAGTMDQGKEVLAKYKVSWLVDGQGWTRRANGEITDAIATIQFTVKSN
jgi:hypothetical protein